MNEKYVFIRMNLYKFRVCKMKKGWWVQVRPRVRGWFLQSVVQLFLPFSRRNVLLPFISRNLSIYTIVKRLRIKRQKRYIRYDIFDHSSSVLFVRCEIKIRFNANPSAQTCVQFSTPTNKTKTFITQTWCAFLLSR